MFRTASLCKQRPRWQRMINSPTFRARWTSGTMTTAHTPSLRELVEDFLYKRGGTPRRLAARRLGRVVYRRCRYVVPTTDLPEGDPKRDLVFIDDDITRLRARAARLNSRHAHREYPWSRTRRFVTNVRVAETEDGELSVTANVLVYRFRSGEGAPYVGSVHYILRRDNGELRIAYRRAVLDLESLSWHGAVSIIF